MVARQFGKKVVPRGLSLDHRAVAKADVNRGRPGDPVERALERRDAIRPRVRGMHLHVRLVDLHDVRAGGEEVTDLGVHRGGVVHRQFRVGRVVVVLRQLGHRERAGHRDLDLTLGVRPQELHITHVDRAQPPNAPDDSRHERRLAGAADHRPWMIEVDPVERGRKPVEVALAPHLAVRHDVDAGALLIANRDQRGIVLRLLEQFGGDTPELPHPHARRGIRGEQRSVDEPFRLRIRADDRCRKQFSLHR